MTSTIRDCIADPARMDEIPDLIEAGKDHYGSQTFDQHLMDLVNEGEVDFRVAKAAANNPADFDLKMNMFTDPNAKQPGSRDPKQGMADEMSKMFGG